MPLAVGRSTVHLDVPLSNFAVRAFAAGTDGLVGNMLAPQVNVGKQSDKYYKIDKDAFQRIPNTRRSPRTSAHRVQFSVSSDSYFAENYALAVENPLEDLENADIAIQLRQNSTMLAVTNLLRDQENRIASKLTSITNIGSGVLLTGTAKWSDLTNSDPLGDINSAHAFIRRQTGLIANTVTVDWDTLMVLRRHPALLDLYKHTSGGELSADQLQQVFKVQRVLVANSIKENAVEGGTSSITNIWGNIALLTHNGAATGLQSMTPIVRMNWQNPIFPANFGVMTSVEGGAGQRKIEILEAGTYQDEKIVAPDLAYLIGNTL